VIVLISELARSKGFVPFVEISGTVLNDEFLESASSFCWRCKKAYKLIGINLNLNSIAGTCACIYNSKSNGFVLLINCIRGFVQCF